MTNKSLRDYINLIETAEQGVAEGVDENLLFKLAKRWYNSADPAERDEINQKLGQIGRGFDETPDGDTGLYNSDGDFIKSWTHEELVGANENFIKKPASKF